MGEHGVRGGRFSESELRTIASAVEQVSSDYPELAGALFEHYSGALGGNFGRTTAPDAHGVTKQRSSELHASVPGKDPTVAGALAFHEFAHVTAGASGADIDVVEGKAYAIEAWLLGRADVPTGSAAEQAIEGRLAEIKEYTTKGIGASSGFGRSFSATLGTLLALDAAAQGVVGPQDSVLTASTKPDDVMFRAFSPEAARSMLKDLVTTRITSSSWEGTLIDMYTKMSADHPGAPGTPIGEIFAASFLDAHEGWRKRSTGTD